MPTAAEILQAQSIVFKIRSGRSVRTDPRSTVGRLVNRALQRQIDLQASLRLQREFERKTEEKRLQQSIPRKPITPKPKPVLQSFPKPKPKPKKLFTPLPEQITRISKPKSKKIIGRITETISRKIITPLSLRQKKLIKTSKKREIKKIEVPRGRKITFKESKIISQRAEREFLKSANVKAQIFVLTSGKILLQNLKAFKDAPEDIKEIIKKIKKDPSIIKKLGKDLPAILKEEGKAQAKLFKTSPTEAIAIVGGNVLFFAGTGKVLKLVGKIGKIPSKAIKKSVGNKKGTPLRFVGTQSQKGNVITTKIVFKVGKKQIGGAIGTSKIKGEKILTQTIGVVGKGKIKKVAGKPRVKKFKQKAVFAGRQISVARRQRLAVRKRVRGITITENVQGLIQVGVGRVAVAKGKKLVSTTIQFPTGRLKKKKVRSLRVKDFVSISAVLTKKDLSLIVGKTLKSKKDVTNFVGLIKGVSKKNFGSFSPQKQILFKQALQDVAGTISATTTRSKKIIPKLSPKSKKVILKRVSGKISKGKVIVGVKAVQKVKIRLAAKVKQKVLTKVQLKLQSKLKTVQKQKNILLQKTKLSTAQKQKLLTLQKQISQSKTKGVFVPISAIPRVKFPVRLRIKRRKVKVSKRKSKKLQAYKVLSRPLKRKGQKRIPKLIKVNVRPLTKTQAERLGSTLADTTISRTFKIKAVRGKPKRPTLKTRSFKKRKFRSFRIKKGKRIGLKNTFIEKRKFLIDSAGERKGLSLRRGLAKLRKESKVKPKKRILTPSQRSKLLKNLKKARAVKRKSIKKTKTFKRKR